MWHQQQQQQLTVLLHDARSAIDRSVLTGPAALYVVYYGA
jgi:hypothetical protein